MQKILIGILSTVILLTISPIFKSNAQGLSKPLGTSSKASLYLYGENGESAKMIYLRAGQYFEYILNGHNLLPNTQYTLIYYPQKTVGLICMGQGESNNGGELNMAYDYISITSIPFSDDINGNIETTTYEDGSTGGQIWLLPSNQVDCYNMYFKTDSPSNILYEDKLIYFWMT